MPPSHRQMLGLIHRPGAHGREQIAENVINRIHWIPNIIEINHHKFDVHRAVHPDIIYIIKPTRCTSVSNLFYVGKDALHVSDRLSVHHQEFMTVHTATGICQADAALCLLAGKRWNSHPLASRHQYLFNKCLLLYVQSWTPDDGRKDRPKHVECHYKIK